MSGSIDLPYKPLSADFLPTMEDDDGDSLHAFSKISGFTVDPSSSISKVFSKGAPEKHSLDDSVSFLDNDKRVFEKDPAKIQGKTKDKGDAVKIKGHPQKDANAKVIDEKLKHACRHGDLNVLKDLLGKHYMSLMPDAHGRTPLYEACLADQREVVKFLVEYGFDVNHQDNDGKTPLHVSLEHSLPEMARLLTNKYKANFKLRDSRNWTPFHYAIDTGFTSIAGDLIQAFLKQDMKRTDVSWLQLHAACCTNQLKVVKLLIEHKVDINRVSSSGRTALLLACYENNADIVNCLIAYGADPNIISGRGKGALHVATTAENMDVTRALLSCSSLDVNMQDLEGDTALHRAAFSRHVGIAELLLERGADVDPVNHRHLTPLQIAIHKNDEEMVAILVASGADANVKDEDGDTCLYLAMYEQHDRIVKKLLDDAGVDVNLRNNKGSRCLHIAASRQPSSETLQTIIALSTDVNALNNDHQTALLLACGKARTRTIEMLLEAGADPTICDDDGETCLHWAVHTHCPLDTLKKLVDAGVPLNALDNNCRTAVRLACMERQTDTLKFLLSAGADPNISDKEGDTILHNAVLRNYHPDDLQAVIDAGADLEFKNDDGMTALHIACGKGRTTLAKTLLNAGADPLTKDNASHTLFELAMREKTTPEIFKAFIEYQPSIIDTMTSSDETALHYFCRKGNADMVKYLIDQGANKDLVGQGDLPLDVALDHGHTDIVGILIDAGANVTLAAAVMRLTFLEKIYHQRHMRMPLLQRIITSERCKIDLSRKNYLGETLMFQACRSGVHDVVWMLLTSKHQEIGLNIPNPDGKTPIAISCEVAGKPGIDSVHLITLLLTCCKRDLDVDTKDTDLKTPLHRACEVGSALIANMVLHLSQATLNARDCMGKTPMHYARLSGNPDLVDLMRKHGAVSE